jgi:hypothetical protein
MWSALFSGIYFISKKNAKGALLLGGLVMSHWILDWITHHADLPLIPGSELKVGLGLWNSFIISVLFESLIFVGGIFLYLRTTKAQNRKGRFGFWALFIFFTFIFIMNLTGPPPPSEEPVAYVGLAQWIFVIWAYWIDRNRKIR